MEIDLPPGTVSPTRKPGETVTITGATIKVTQPGTGGGGTVTGTGTTGAGAPGTTGATGTGAPGTTGSTGTAAPGTTGSTGTAAPGTTGTTATTVPGATGAAPAPVATPDRAALERQVLADGPTRDLYKALLSKEGAVPTAEFLQRLLALEALIHRNGAKIAPLVAQAPGGGQGKDPIKDVIEPLEKLLLNEDVKLEQAMDKAIKSASGGPTGQTGQTGTTGQTGGQTGQAGATGQTGPTGPSLADLGQIRRLQFAPLVRTGQIQVLQIRADDALAKAPPQTFALPAEWTIATANAKIRYVIPLTWTLVNTLQTQSGDDWDALYQTSPPSGAILSDDGDRPIQFIDTDVVWRSTLFVGKR